MGKRKFASDPALDVYFAAIDQADFSDNTKRQYKRVLQGYFATGATLADGEALQEYGQSLAPSSRAFLKAAVRFLGATFEKQLHEGIHLDNLSDRQSILYRLEATKAASPVRAVQPEKHHPWLSASEVRQLLATCGDDLEGLRDWITLALLVGTGIRTKEIIRLKFAAVSEIPRQGGDRGFAINISGEGTRERTIPVDPLLAERLRKWHEIVGDGLIARSIRRKRELGESISITGIVAIVHRHGSQIQKPYLAPRDLRRTFAQLSYEAGVSIIEITRLLGNSSILTTQRYLNVNIEVEQTMFDFIPLE